MSKEIKFDLDKDIIMQIEMDSYKKYNDTIASMNDHLGEIYGYSDVRNTEEAKLKYEKELAYKAIVQLQQKVEQLEKENIKQKEIIENLTTMTVCGDKKQIKNTAQYKLEQLENIRKEAIEELTYMSTDAYVEDYDIREKHYNLLMNILNKGE
jgi:putative NADH-flavin reductase